ncbi:MAG: cell division protein FtsW [Candidatus Magasanikbacteria bacterium]|nr:cell division protein FtsW [Candidatus Magasanikbacteria bacterium]
MPKEKKADYRLLSYFLILLVFGLVMLSSASVAVGYQKFGDAYFYIKKQLLFGVLPGLLLFFIFAKTDYHLLRKFGLAIYCLAMILLLVVFLPGIGSAYGTHANSWISLWGYSFQPAEFAKLGMVIFLSYFIARKGKEIGSFQRGFLVTLGVGIAPIVLVALQPDIGTVAILFAILFGLLYVGRANIWHLIALAAAGLSGLVILVASAPYRAARLTTFLHPELDPQGIGYHINQAFLAIGSGGWLGRGLGGSLQKFQYLPEVAADSIYAIVAEEMGFIFAAGLIVLLILIARRGFFLAKKAPDEFGRMMVAGIIIWFVTQSFLNIGAMVGLLPLTGVPLPFVSHGGTALMIALAAVGVLANVSKQTDN